jgi:hypothetical protein
MSVKSRKFSKGIRLKGTTEAATLDGEIRNDSANSKIKVNVESAEREIVTADQTQTIENKTIDGTDATGNNTVKADASDITYDPAGSGLVATTSQAALDELDGDVDAVETSISDHLADAVDAHDASAISNVPSGNLAATDVQGALNELQGDIDTANTNLSDHLSDAVDAHDASAISNVPSGNLAATDVQGALNELQSDIDLRALANNGAFQNGAVITPSRLDVKQDTEANLITYATTAGDGQIVFATDTQKMYQVIDNALEPIGGGGSTSFEISQTTHGFAVGEGIYHNGTNWVKGQANASGTLAYHVVVEVPDANTFIAADFGRIEATSHGYTVGQYYFLSESVAGQATTIEPSTGFSNPLFYVEDVNTLQVKVYRPNAIDGGINLDQLNDVTAPSPSDGQGLVWVNANSRWENVDVATQVEIDAHTSATSAHGISGDVVGTSDAQVITNKDIDGGTASNTSRITLPKDTKTNLDGLTRKEGTVVYGTDTQKAYVDNGTDLIEVGSGSGAGGINYITNPDLELNADDYNEYADAAGENPVDGTGGTALGVTATRNTTSPMRGDGDLKIAKDAANRQGEGVSTDFTIDNADQSQKLTISIDYDASHSGYADGDIRFSVYDVTNAKLIRVNGEDLKGGKGTHIAQFQTAADSTSYRLIIHVSSTYNLF